MEVNIIPCLEDNYSYIIVDKKNKSACVIDPSESVPIINFIENNNLKLNYILNTHHHFDHIGGNDELKKKYKAKIIGFADDYKRIPGIDILLKDGEIWKENNFEAKIIHIPGHTSGHICYYFYKEKNLFSGDTLFSLGCGRIFEGTYKEMYESLSKLKKFPPNTKIYCGHEYTKKNSDFCLSIESKNSKLINKINKINKNIQNGNPTIPSILSDELECNIFLRSDNIEIQKQLGVNRGNPIEAFAKLRELKDNF